MDYMLLPEAYRDNPYEDIDSCQKYYYEKYLRNLQACRKMHSKDYIEEKPAIKDKSRSKKNYKAIEDNPLREKMNRYHRNRINKNNPNYNPFEPIKHDYNSFNPFKLDDDDNLSDLSSIGTDYTPSVLSSQGSYKPFSKKGSMTTSRAKDILSLASDADTDRIKGQFRKKIFSNHPDKNKTRYANLNTQEILDARRKMYSRRNSMYGKSRLRKNIRKKSRKNRKSADPGRNDRRQRSKIVDGRRPLSFRSPPKAGIRLASRRSRLRKRKSKKKKRKTSLRTTKGRSYGKKWSNKYKKSINCKNPKGFSQRAHCNSKKKRSSRRKKFGNSVVLDPLAEALSRGQLNADGVANLLAFAKFYPNMIDVEKLEKLKNMERIPKIMCYKDSLVKAINSFSEKDKKHPKRIEKDKNRKLKNLTEEQRKYIEKQAEILYNNNCRTIYGELL